MLRNEQRWRNALQRAAQMAIECGPLRDGDTVRLGAAEAPPERTMVETDTPYLNPIDKSSPNEPANVVRVGEALAGVWGMPVDQVAELTSATATRVFRGG